VLGIPKRLAWVVLRELLRVNLFKSLEVRLKILDGGALRVIIEGFSKKSAVAKTMYALSKVVLYR